MSEAPAWKPGDAVWYTTGYRSFAATVDTEPWQLGHGEWVVRLTGLGADYREYTGRERRTVSAAACCALARRDFRPGEVEIRALEKIAAYSDHTAFCVVRLEGGRCDCGLEEARAALAEARKA